MSRVPDPNMDLYQQKDQIQQQIEALRNQLQSNQDHLANSSQHTSRIYEQPSQEDAMSPELNRSNLTYNISAEQQYRNDLQTLQMPPQHQQSKKVFMKPPLGGGGLHGQQQYNSRHDQGYNYPNLPPQ